jgi:hypothetical protein
MNKKIILTEELKIVDLFESTNKDFGFETNDKQTQFYKDENNYILETEINIEVENINKLSIVGKIFNFNSFELLINSSLPKSWNHIEPTLFNVFDFQEKHFQTNDKYYRFIIPNLKNIRFDLNFNRDLIISVDSEMIMYALNGIAFKIDSKECFLFYHYNKLIFQCNEKISYEKFYDMSIIVLSVLGYINGYCPKERGYIFEYDNFSDKFKSFRCNLELGKTFKTSFNIIDGNPYSYRKSNEKHGFNPMKGLEKQLGFISKVVFENLCNNILNNNEFELAFFSLLDITNGSLITPLDNAMFCVVLETLTNMIVKENEDEISWHADKVIKREHRKILLKTSQQFFQENDLKDFENSYIKNKIDNIDKIPNSISLKKPFELLEISLTVAEEAMLKKRNHFLHGRHNYQRSEFQQFISEYRTLNFIINALILKYVGFSGIVLNLNKDNEGEERYKVL